MGLMGTTRGTTERSAAGCLKAGGQTLTRVVEDNVTLEKRVSLHCIILGVEMDTGAGPHMAPAVRYPDRMANQTRLAERSCPFDLCSSPPGHILLAMIH